MEALVKTPVLAPQEGTAHLGPISSNQTRELYNENIARIKHFIREGDIFQAVIPSAFLLPMIRTSFPFTASLDGPTPPST